MKWYVEFRCYGKQMYDIVYAVDGKAAIEYIKDHYIGGTHFKVFKEED